MATCPRCSAELAPDAPQGLCPACLLEQGVNPTAGPTAFDTPDRTIPDDASLWIEQMAIAFPQLDQFQLIGRGGMGVVFKARQKQLDRFVALKLLSSRIVQSAAFTERFGREARALARLNHPNIVAVYDFGHVPTPGDSNKPLYYLMMEYVDGASLRTLLKTFSPAQALAIVPQVCEALQYAHDLDVVHRDIKPENIILDRKGRVKIADFGLAKLGQAVRPDLNYTLTQPDMVMGTPHYMAPEQLEKPAAVDHRADLYSLGVVFYELLTGELPIGRFQPPSAKVQVDVRLDEVVLKSLEKEPQRRYQHASELKTQVETISGHVAPAVGGVNASTVGATSSDRSAISVSGVTKHYSLPAGAAAINVGAPESWKFYLRAFLLYSIAWIAGLAMWNLGWTGFFLTVMFFSVVSWGLVRRLLEHRPQIIASRLAESGWKNRYRKYIAPLFFPAAFAILVMVVAVSGDGEGSPSVASIFEMNPSIQHSQDFLKSYQADHPAELPGDIRDLTLKNDFGLYPVFWSLNTEKLPPLPSTLLVPIKPTTGQLTRLVSRVLLFPSAIPPEFRKLPYFSLYALLGLFFVFACAADMLSSKAYRFTSHSLWPPILMVITLFASYIAVLMAHGLFASFVQSSRLSHGQLMVSEGRYMLLTKPGDASSRLLPALDHWAIEHGYEIAALTQGELQDNHRFPVVPTSVTYQAAVLWKPGLFDRLHMDWQGLYKRAPEILVESASSKAGSRISITLPVFPTIKAENEAGNALQKDLHETLSGELP